MVEENGDAQKLDCSFEFKFKQKWWIDYRLEKNPSKNVNMAAKRHKQKENNKITKEKKNKIIKEIKIK